MRAAGIEVRLHVAQVHIHQTERLCPVNHGKDSALARDPAKLSGGQEIARGAGEVREGQDLRAGIHLLREGVDVVFVPWMRVHLIHDPDGKPEAPGFFSPGKMIARMVVGEDDDLVLRFQLDSAGDQVVRFTRIACDDDLLGGHAQKRGQQFACPLLALGHLLAVVEGGILIDIPSRSVQGLEDRSRGGTKICRVHDRQVRGHEELFADVGPECFIRKLRRFRQGSRPGPRKARSLDERGAAGARQKARKVPPANPSVFQQGLSHHRDPPNADLRLQTSDLRLRLQAPGLRSDP